MAERLAKRVSVRRSTRGFSLVELLLSLAVLGILLVISVPTLMRAYRSYQLNDAATRFSGIMKSTRFSAIRKNTPISFRVQQNGATWTIWADLDGDSNPGGAEPQTLVGGSVSLLNAGTPPSPDAITTSLGSSLNVLSPGNSSVLFDQRGARPGASTVDVFYFGSTAIADLGFRAVVVLPSGMVQVWTADPAGPWVRVS